MTKIFKSHRPKQAKQQKYAQQQRPEQSPSINLDTGEVGGPEGLEPTRYGDWERKGICVDF